MSSGDVAILLENLHKSYYLGRGGDGELPVLKGINIAVSEGEFLAVLGSSGSGKTTLLNLVCGFDSPTEGKVVIDGNDISVMSENDLVGFRNDNLGIVFQNFNLLSSLTAAQNLELTLMRKGLSHSQRVEKVKETLELIGMDDRGENYPHELSGGQQQRIAIARSVVGDPSLLIIDEPTGSLDSKIGKKMIDILVDFNKNQNLTVMMVTHNYDAVRSGMRLLYLQDGIISHDLVIREKEEKEAEKKSKKK